MLPSALRCGVRNFRFIFLDLKALAMNETLHDHALREAGAALTKAIRALQDVNERALADEALRLANDVLRARQRLPRPLTGTGR